MKKIYLSILIGLSVSFSQAQNLVVSLSSNNVCAGESIEAYVQGPELELASPAVGGNNNSGVMFDVLGVEGAIIKGFKVNPLIANSSFEVYYRPGSFVGFENSSTGWTLLGSSTGVAMGTGINIGIDLNQVVLPGQTVAFYVTTTSSGEVIQYANGTAVGAELTSDFALTVYGGIGKAYPFGTSNTPRDFIGSIIYEPILTNIAWSANLGETSNTAEITPVRTMGVAVTANYGGGLQYGSALLTVKDYEAQATANPAVLGWGQSSTLSANVNLSTGLGTTFQGGNSNSGAMFDVYASRSLSINGFSVSLLNSVSPTADLEIFYKTGTFVGAENTASSWTSLGAITGAATGYNVYVPLSSELSMTTGQTFGFYITRTDGETLRYTNGTGIGTVVANDGNLIIKEGIGNIYPFGGSNANRIINTVVHYELENPTGLNYSWAPGGGSTPTKLVTPNADVTYTVTVDDGFCEATAEVSVTMAVGIEEDLANNIQVYPNPATDNITIALNNPMNVEKIALMDLSGKVVFSTSPNGSITKTLIPVANLAKGLYLLQLEVEGAVASYKVQVN